MLNVESLKQIRQGKLIGPSKAVGYLFDAAVGNATDLFVEHQTRSSMDGEKKPSFAFSRFGSGLDIHKVIGKLPRPKASFTPSKYKYMGP